MLRLAERLLLNLIMDSHIGSLVLRSKLLRRAESVLVQCGARRHGISGNYGKLGIVESVSCRI